MEHLIQSYYAYLRERLMRGDSPCPEMAHWEEFLFFLLEHSIPQQFSAAVSLLNLGKIPASEIALEDHCHEMALPCYRVHIQGERAEESCPIAFTIQALLECIQREISERK